MPILNDIMDHEVLGPKLRQARAEGLEEGREEGRQEGLQQGERHVLARQIQKRFGSLPVWMSQRLDRMTVAEIEDTALRLLDATSLEDFLGCPS